MIQEDKGTLLSNMLVRSLALIGNLVFALELISYSEALTTMKLDNWRRAYRRLIKRRILVPMTATCLLGFGTDSIFITARTIIFQYVLGMLLSNSRVRVNRHDDSHQFLDDQLLGGRLRYMLYYLRYRMDHEIPILKLEAVANAVSDAAYRMISQ